MEENIVEKEVKKIEIKELTVGTRKKFTALILKMVDISGMKGVTDLVHHGEFKDLDKFEKDKKEDDSSDLVKILEIFTDLISQMFLIIDNDISVFLSELIEIKKIDGTDFQYDGKGKLDGSDFQYDGKGKLDGSDFDFDDKTQFNDIVKEFNKMPLDTEPKIIEAITKADNFESFLETGMRLAKLTSVLKAPFESLKKVYGSIKT